MPAVFNPGETEVRPLRPEETIYTTPQRVADLLDIGKPEAVAISAASVSDGVYVTGADYRNHGFEVGDSILIYSDAAPLGVTKTITAITDAGASGVKLAFTGSFTHANYDLANDNTFVQNQASFTNRTGRGVTKDKVDRLILRAQDVIDNKTHNAWRPYLVVGEYINFDTYKPYRRRYYTDYVGTAPLMFKNTQQLLRVELWQGDDYREVGSAEARVKIIDHSALHELYSAAGNCPGVYLCPGGGGMFKLCPNDDYGYYFRAEFDNTTTAQELANLINHDTQTGKKFLYSTPSEVTAYVDPTTGVSSTHDTRYSLPDASSSTGSRYISVNEEFLATANADYGSGIVKITSMRHTKGGESSTIATTEPATTLEISQTNTISISGTYSLPSGYGDQESGFASSGASWLTHGAEIAVTSTEGFAPYGLLTIEHATGQHCVLGYRRKTATKFDGVFVMFSGDVGSITGVAKTYKQHQLSIDYQGGSSVGDHARLRDLWLDHKDGIIFFNNSYPFFEWNAIKASYIYGERYVEKAIEDVCTKMVAIELLMSDDRSVLIPEGTQNVDLTSKIQLWQRDIETTLSRYRQLVVFD